MPKPRSVGPMFDVDALPKEDAFGDSRLPQRFWSKVKLVDCVLRPDLGLCWLWLGAHKSDGYGELIIGSRTDGTRKVASAPRFAYEILVGPIPEGLEPDHLCRNPGCVNPAHLEIVTHHENTLRGDAGKHNSVKTHCPKGHPYDENNTSIYHGHRSCKACHRECDARRRAKKK